MFACGRGRGPFSLGTWCSSEEQTPQKAERVSPMKIWKVISSSAIYLEVICMCIYFYYSFISKAHHRSFTIYLPLAMVFLFVSLYARKRLKTLESK